MRETLLVVLASVLLVSCGPNRPPVVGQGQAELTGYDFSQGQLISLDGQWDFVPGQLVTQSPTWVPIEVPGLWLDQVFRGTPGTVFGVGTYHLRIRLSPS